MNIGILTEIISYHSGARAPLEIAKHLAKRGNQIVIYAYDFNLNSEAKTDLQRHKCSIVLFKKPSIPIIGKYLTIPKVYSSIKKHSHHAMYFSGTPPFFLAGKLSGIPIIRMYQGTQFDAYVENKNPDEKLSFLDILINKIVNLAIYLIDFMSFRLSNGVVAISRYAAWEGKQLYQRQVNGIIYHGTTQLHQGKSLRKIQKRKVEILSVSRITPYKGFHLIIKAMKQIKTNRKFTLTIVGSQPKYHYLKYLEKVGGSNLKIVLNPQDEDLSKLYQLSDFYITADKYLYFGLPIYEAAQFEKPTISLNVAAAGELIEHGKTGFIAQNTDELANYMKLLIEDDNLREKLGRNAKKKSRFFSWEKCAEEWEKIIKEIVREKR